MQCDYFGKCASCTLFDKSYKEQLAFKLLKATTLFNPLYNKTFDIIKSKTKAFRARCEFKIWHKNGQISYAMNHLDKKSYIPINSCSIVNISIQELMPKLLVYIKQNDMENKLFNINFLSTISKEMIVSLIYHKHLDDVWKLKAKNLAKFFNIKIVGRSHKQKIVLSDDFITETLIIKDLTFKFIQIENSFTQPNPLVNIEMISWVMDAVGRNKSDLLELYCGLGNFSLPLSTCFNKVIATEISKSSIRAALINCKLNDISNITFVRMSSKEFVQAVNKKRQFRRLKDINLDTFNIKSIFLNPPRKGLEQITIQLAQKFDTIIYISCNIKTLKQDLDVLNITHEIKKMAIFDQFAYTKHLEMGVILIRKQA